jgi:enoyl-CoA hydratase
MHFHPWFLGMRKAMEMFMTGDSVTGVEAVRYGWANASFPADQLESGVLKVAEKISKLPIDVLRLNKRAIHRQMEVMGLRTGIRAGTELCALGTHTQSMADFVADIQSDGLTGALDRRDSKFGDYRTTDNPAS